MSAKGYVVRGKDDDGKAWAVYAKANVSGWRTHTDATESRDAATLFETPDEAARSAADFRERFGTVAIFAVAEDGTETPLPSYEEALAENERLRATAEDVCCGFTEEGEVKGPLSLRINRLRVALGAQKAKTA